MVKIERLQEICLMVISQLEAYKEKYDELKDSLQLEGTEVIWCKGWRAPHEPIFCEELTYGNITEPRHPIDKEPRKKDHVSVHYYRDKKPVYSQIYGEEQTVIGEIFYTQDSEKRYGITYDTSGNVDMFSIELQNEKGLPTEYILYRKEVNYFSKVYRNRINYAAYEYDNNDMMMGGILLHEMGINSNAENLINELRHKIEIKSEESLKDMDKTEDILLFCLGDAPEEYKFNYVDGILNNYTRNDYNYSMEFEGEGGPWKYPKYLLKRYHDFGIKYV